MAKVMGKSGAFTFNSISMYATDINVDGELGEVDVTNLQSSGNYECDGDISKTTFSCSAVVESGSAPNVTQGQSGTTTLAVTGGHTVTGTAKIFRVSRRAAPRGAYGLQISGSYTGAVTVS